VVRAQLRTERSVVGAKPKAKPGEGAFLVGFFGRCRSPLSAAAAPLRPASISPTKKRLWTVNSTASITSFPQSATRTASLIQIFGIKRATSIHGAGLVATAKRDARMIEFDFEGSSPSGERLCPPVCASLLFISTLMLRVESDNHVSKRKLRGELVPHWAKSTEGPGRVPEPAKLHR